jgi:hypothetical protein
MKRLPLKLLIAGVMVGLLSSCASLDMVARAEGKPGPMDADRDNPAPREPQPAYYALVPLTLPFDLVFWPVQYVMLQNRNSDE